jgi:hypothetical protein
MNGFTGSIVAIVGLFAGVAIVAALVSKNANTAALTQNFFAGTSQALGAALSPITGGNGSMSGPAYAGSTFA